MCERLSDSSVDLALQVDSKIDLLPPLLKLCKKDETKVRAQPRVAHLPP